MKRYLYILILFLYSLIFPLNAQNISSWEDYLVELYEYDSYNESAIEYFYELYDRLSDHPLDLNSLKYDQLKQFIFLNEAQLKCFWNYLEINRPLYSVYELKNIPLLDKRTLNLLKPFFCVQDVDNKQNKVYKRWKRVKQELIYGTRFTLQNKKGYNKNRKDTARLSPYLGNKYAHIIRYRLDIKDIDSNKSFGLLLDNDAGEPMFSSYNPVFDFSTFFFHYRGNKLLKTLVLGDFRVSFGQGLVANHNYFSFGMANVSNKQNRSFGIRPHNSVNESNYLRGFGIMFGSDFWDLSLFGSLTRRDGKVISDTILSTKSDGLHRIERDFEKKHSFLERIGGVNLRINKSGFALGFTGVYTDYGNAYFNSFKRLDKLYSFKGKRRFNFGIDYHYSTPNITSFGECAWQEKGFRALLLGLNLHPYTFANFTFLYRNYQKEYESPIAKSFSRGGRINNEEGVYIGIEVVPFRKWRFASFVDIYKFPWVRYGKKTGESGKLIAMQIRYLMNDFIDLQTKIRKRYYENYETLQTKFEFRYSVSDKIRFYIGGDCNCYNKPSDITSNSFSIYQQFTYLPNEKLDLNLFLGYIPKIGLHAPIFMKERRMLYDFGISSMFDKGLRSSVLIKYNLSSHVCCYFKVGNNHFFHKKQIGQGRELILGKNKTDLSILMKIKI